MADEKPPALAAGHPLAALRRFTEARIGLGRFGAGLPTAAHLDFAEAHARARDAVHAAFDIGAMERRLNEAGLECLQAGSEAPDRATYLRRPDLGRKLDPASRQTLAAAAPPDGVDVALIIADGLSALAVESHAAETAIAIATELSTLRLSPVVLAREARVALSDPIGEALRARLAIMLIGERPGLTAADSLGAYLTFGPRPGRTDADRNCVSNIRKGGLLPAAAALKIATLTRRSLALGFSGTRLKDEDELPPADEAGRIETR